MDETNNDGPIVKQPQVNGEDNTPHVAMVTQYVKDMSVENPRSPQIFQAEEDLQFNVQFNIGAEPAGDDGHEVQLQINVVAESNGKAAYQIELLYAGIFVLRNLPEEHAHQFIFAEAPRLIFPFARQIIANAVRDAGFPQFILEPIDFHGLYEQQRAQAGQENAQNNENREV